MTDSASAMARSSDARTMQRYHAQAVLLMLAVSLVWIAGTGWLFAARPPVAQTGLQQDIDVAKWFAFALAAAVILLTGFTLARTNAALLITSVGHALVLAGLYLSVLLGGGTGLMADPWQLGAATIGVLFAAVVTVGSAMAYRSISMLSLVAETESHQLELEQMAGTRLVRKPLPLPPPASATEAKARASSRRIAAVDPGASTSAKELDKAARSTIKAALMEGVKKAYSPSVRTVIQVQNLMKNYGPIRAVDGISFTIDRGEIIGFLGPNGAGKSTTMKVLTTYLGKTAGSASVGGYDIDREPLQVREKIGYLPESTPLYREMRVSAYLDFIARARHVPYRRLARNLAWVREACGLSPVWNQRIMELSKGFRQRVGLAQAMVHEPEVLILDEPSSGLDPNQIVEMRELIRDLGRDDRAIVLSTHILQEVTALCTRVMIINQGQLVANGTVDELTRAIHPLNRVIARVQSTKKLANDLMKLLDEASRVSVTVESGAGKSTISRIEASPEEGVTLEDLGQKMTTILSEDNVPVLELRNEQPTLEDVFLTLTHGLRT